MGHGEEGEEGVLAFLLRTFSCARSQSWPTVDFEFIGRGFFALYFFGIGAGGDFHWWRFENAANPNFTEYFLYAVHSLLTVLFLMNLIIAMMTKTMENMWGHVNSEWSAPFSVLLLCTLPFWMAAARSV